MARIKSKRSKFPAIVASQKPDHPSSVARESGAKKLTDDEIVQILEGYRNEAEYARVAGPSSRDLTWLQHLDLYWNRFDFSKKAPWQSREVLPEFPQYVDRCAAAMRTALISSERFFTVAVQGDDNQDLAPIFRKLMIAILRRVGRTATGQPIDFLNVFEEATKQACLSMYATLVTWKDDGEHGYAAVENEDPYNVWLDPTGRGLYRIRRVEMDMHELRALADLTDDLGAYLYDRDAIEACTASIIALMRAEREKRTGTGQWVTGNRRPVVLHEYLCTLIDSEGHVQGTNVLCVVANNRFLIRGPEANPFKHGRDWMVTAAMIPVPLAPYGKSYAENFAQIARTFNETTNLMLDGVLTSAMKVFAIVPGALEDPSQVEEGIYPNVLFRLNEGEKPSEFMEAVEMGMLPQDAFQIWQALKKELQEGAAFNEMTLGQSAPKGRTSATEVGTVEQNATSYIRSIASNIETGFLEPVLQLLFWTTIQHMEKGDQDLRNAVGDQWYDAILANREEFLKLKSTFTVRGISGLLMKKQKLQDLMQLLQVIGANPEMAQAFLQQVSPQRLWQYLADLLDVELDRIQMTAREKMIQQGQAAQAQQQQQFQEQQANQAQAQGDAIKAQVESQAPAQKEASAFRQHAQKTILDHLLQFTPANQQQTRQELMSKHMIGMEKARHQPAPRPQQGGGQGGPSQQQGI